MLLKRIVLAAAVSLAFVSAAAAQNFRGQAQGQAQGQLQGQEQQLHSAIWNNPTNTNTNVFAPGVVTSNRTAVGVQNRNRVNVGGQANSQHMVYQEARDYRQAPGTAAQFSSTVGNPCEGVPVGIGGSSAVPNPFSAILQIPRESDRCNNRADAVLLQSWGYQGAAVAVLAGNPVAQAVQNNPVQVRYTNVRQRATYARYNSPVRRNARARRGR